MRTPIRPTLRLLRLAAAAALVAGCGDAIAPAVPTVDDLAGEYELTRVGTQPLPANTGGRATVHAGHLSLGRDQRYTRRVQADACLPTGDCSAGTTVTSGAWLILRDGSLYLDREDGYSWPPQPIEADGREVRFYVAGARILDQVYERR